MAGTNEFISTFKQGKMDDNDVVRRGAAILAARHRMQPQLFGTDEEIARGLVARELGATQVRELGYVRGHHEKVASFVGGEITGSNPEIARMKRQMKWVREQFGDAGWDIKRVEVFSTDAGSFSSGRHAGRSMKMRNYRVTIKHAASESMTFDLPEIRSLLPHSIRGGMANATDMGYYMYNGSVWATSGEISNLYARNVSGELSINAESARLLTHREKYGSVIREATSLSPGMNERQFQKNMAAVHLGGKPVPIGGPKGADVLRQMKNLVETTQVAPAKSFFDDVEKMGFKGGVKLASMLMETLRTTIGTGSELARAFLHPNPNRDTGRMLFVDWQKLIPGWGSENYMKARTGNIQISGAQRPRIRVAGDNTVPSTFNARVAKIPLAAADDAHWLTERALGKIGMMDITMASNSIAMSHGRTSVGTTAVMGGDLADKIRYLVEKKYINGTEDLFKMDSTARRKMLQRAGLEIGAGDVIGVDYAGQAVRWRHDTVSPLSGIDIEEWNALDESTRESLFDRRMRGKIYDIVPDEGGRSFRVVVNGQLHPGEANLKVVKADSTARQIAKYADKKTIQSSMETALRLNKDRAGDWKNVNIDKADIIAKDMYTHTDIMKTLGDEGIFIRDGKIVGLGVYDEYDRVTGKLISHSVGSDKAVSLRGERTRERLGQILASIDDMTEGGGGFTTTGWRKTLENAGIKLTKSATGEYEFILSNKAKIAGVDEMLSGHKQWEATIAATLEFYGGKTSRLLPNDIIAAYGITDYAKVSPLGAMIEPSVLAEFGRTQGGADVLLGIMEMGVDPARANNVAGEDVATEIRRFLDSVSGKTVDAARDIATTNSPTSYNIEGRTAWRGMEGQGPGWYDVRTGAQRAGKQAQGWMVNGREINQFYMPDLEKLGLMTKHAQDSYILNSDLGHKINEIMKDMRAMSKNSGNVSTAQIKALEDVVATASDAILRNGQFYDNLMKFRAQKSSVYKVTEAPMFMDPGETSRILGMSDATERARAIRGINKQGKLLPGQIAWSADYAEGEIKSLRNVIGDAGVEDALGKLRRMVAASAGPGGIGTMNLSDLLDDIGLISMRQPMHLGWEKNIFAVDPVIIAGDPSGIAGSILGQRISGSSKRLADVAYAQSTGVLSIMDFDADTLAHMFVGKQGKEALAAMRDRQRTFWADAMGRIAEAQKEYSSMYKNLQPDAKQASWLEVVRSHLVGTYAEGIDRKGVMGMMDFKAMERMLEEYDPRMYSRRTNETITFTSDGVQRASIAQLRAENEAVRKRITDTSARRKYFGLLNSKLRQVEEASIFAGDVAQAKNIKSVTGALQQMDIWFKRISTADIEGTLGSRFLEGFEALSTRSRPEDILKVSHDIWFDAAGGANASPGKVQMFIDQLGAMAGEEFKYAPPVGIRTMDELREGAGKAWYQKAVKEGINRTVEMLDYATIAKNDTQIAHYFRSGFNVKGRATPAIGNIFEITESIFGTTGGRGKLVSRMYNLSAGFEVPLDVLSQGAASARKGKILQQASAIIGWMGANKASMAKYGLAGFAGIAAIGAASKMMRSPRQGKSAPPNPQKVHGYDEPGGYDVRGTVDIGTANRLSDIMQSAKVDMGRNEISMRDDRSTVDPLSIAEKRRRASMYGF